MKFLKMLGLAAIAAAALAAFVGVGSASAVTLCEENLSTGCKTHVNSGGEIHFSAEKEGSVKLAGPFGITIATCTESTVKGTTGSTGTDSAAAISGTVTVLTFAGCNRLVTVEKKGTLAIVESGSEGNGTVTSNGATVMIHEVPAPFPSTCAYITENTDIGKLTASATAATFDIEATINTETPNCPNGTWSGKYVSTPAGESATIVKAVAH